MIPENAGGNALPVPSSANVRCSNDMPYQREQRQWHQNQLQEGVISNFGTDSNLCAARVNPAANTATPELPSQSD